MKRGHIVLCLVLSLVALVPASVDALNLDFPIWLRFALLPLAEALHYTAVVIHEPGHAITHWLFGEPALPTLDFEHGGGMTYTPGRSYALTIFVYALAASAMFLLHRAGKKRAAIIIACAIPLHALLITTGWDMFVSLVMGHGAEIIAGGILTTLALARGDILKRAAERIIALTAGLYLIERNAFMCLNLMMNAATRREYAMQKGIPGLGDYQHAGDVIGIPVQAVAGGMLVVDMLCIALALLYAARLNSANN